VFFSLINLIRLIFILILVAPFFLINKEKAIYFFFNFAGPSFIKLGQLLSVRADLVGKQVALTLTKFQDCLEPFSHKKVSNILHQEFKQKKESTLQSILPMALAPPVNIKPVLFSL
jgi:predicted unusual protein kinase regulating ubiquinone biosynthesis (AarF/ABC1/UbiB family)